MTCKNLNCSLSPPPPYTTFFLPTSCLPPGAGKTHTMLGHPEDPGVIFLTMMELYRRIDALKASKTCRVSVSYSEVCEALLPDSPGTLGVSMPATPSGGESVHRNRCITTWLYWRMCLGFHIDFPPDQQFMTSCVACQCLLSLPAGVQ